MPQQSFSAAKGGERQRVSLSLKQGYSAKAHCTVHPTIHSSFAALNKGAIDCSEHNSPAQNDKEKPCSLLNLATNANETKMPLTRLSGKRQIFFFAALPSQTATFRAQERNAARENSTLKGKERNRNLKPEGSESSQQTRSTCY